MSAAGPIAKVLVIKLGALGDFVLALAAMKHIRLAHPKADITLLTTPPFETLAQASGYFNAVETDGRPEGFGGWMAMIGRLRTRGLDVVIIGGPQESALARTIQRSVQARDLTGRTDFAQLAALGAGAVPGSVGASGQMPASFN